MENKSNGKAIASLVLGIISCVFVFSGPASFLGVILGIIGIILGVQAKKEEPSGMAIAGLVLSIIAVAICAISFLSCVACVGAGAVASSLPY
ncbi:hypothetical protein JYG23_14205 [Sedimentibacter sp. zth1]|uniref:hypothetical protein n=1 Tax=Sedimentibacter sp. zth1 TaxID=2816908 RepID=UPI001A91FE6B|nr:hypothetical protein [Sedimentibacter sp. zth1]QSX05798.1 hypothetical protein JYG23_14205 [Sedimentibacter sp. zth1]